MWHYFLDTRAYCGQRIAVSDTGAFAGEEVELHSTGLGLGGTETSAGLTVPAYGVVGRYVRHWAAGNTLNPGVHFIEMAVNAAPVSVSTATSCVVPT